MKLQLPTKKGASTNPTIEFNQLVVVGANGSGKTRFGTDLEKRNPEQTHRISAQKSLTMPSYSSTKSKKTAEIEFLYGHWYEHNPELALNLKFNNRWGQQPDTYLLNDFEKLMVLLHTEEYEESLKYKEGLISKPTTKLDIIQNIWEKLLPHRKIQKRAGLIETYPIKEPSRIYNATEMSDGERVIFYLIGEVICAPRDSIIIIDEPEMHIHKSLLKSLFDLIEIQRKDCAIVYLTHDIDFAFSRQNAIKIWTKSYEENIWDYEILPENSPIPEPLFLEILGSRRQIIFLEGESSSIDYYLYQQVYSDYTIKPLGSCEKVIQTVKAFNEQKAFHHLESFGIIDRDRRPMIDIPQLNSKNIWVLDVAEVENLLLVEGIVKVISNHMGRKPEEVFNQVKANLITFFSSQLENQILLHYKETLRRIFLDISNFKSQKISEVNSEIDQRISSVDKDKIYNEITEEFKNVVYHGDYNAVLRLFNMKNALIPQSKVCDLIGLKNKDEYLKLVVTILKSNDSKSEILKSTIDKKIIKNAT